MTETFATGGSERQFAALAKNLDRQAFRISLGCMRRDGAFFDGMSDVAVFPLGKSLYKLPSWRARARLARHLKHRQVEIAQAFDFYTNLTLIPAARWARIPVVLGSQRQLGDLLTPWQFRMQVLTFRLADAVVCNSRAAANGLRAAGLPGAKIHVIPNGLPGEAFVPTVPAFPRTSTVSRVGMIARMNSHSKNHSALLRAAVLLRTQVPQLEIVFAGDGPLRPELERQASDLGLASIVKFVGDRRDVPAVIASLDVSVLPSQSESLSNSIIESMAQAVPVVATRVGGNEELLGEGRGILTPADDDQALADALATLLLNRSRREEMGIVAQQYARDHFTIETMCGAYRDLYRQLLGKKR
jgi:glycosyltransferase involved in cell wall biosynthesis